jgi:protein translocase SecG subunit
MTLSGLAPFLSVVEIILSVVVIALSVIQSKGSDMSSFMGGGASDSGFRTRRGLEATLHTVTIYFSVAFFVCTLLTFLAWGQR